MRRAVFVLAALLVSGPALAQDFGGVKLKPGQKVRVTDDTGNRTSGPVVSLSPESLRVAGMDFTPARVTKIEREGDALWNGILIGALVGVGLSAIPSEACADNTRLECIGLGVETGVILGLAVDLLRRGHTTIYRRTTPGSKTVSLVPRVDRHARSVAVSMRF